ncbi:MAG: anti-sigma factor [Methyloceanibacter sp.]
MTELSDELLVAYVDGQLADKQSSAIEKVLAQDDVIARRVAALKQAHRKLEAAFDAILAGEEDAAASHPVPPSPGLLIPWATLVKAGLAAAGILLAAGLFIAGFGWPLGGSGSVTSGDPDSGYVGSLPQDWRDEVLRAQALLSRASLEIGLDSQGDRDFIALRLSRAIGAPLALPDLEAKDYRFVRAQVLRVGAEPLAQLLYLGASGAPLALYIKEGGEDAAPEVKRYGALQGVAWSQGGVAYLLAGEGEDEAALARLAETLMKAEPQAER